MLPREEYVEQAYFFRTLLDRQRIGVATQELMAATREEILATTKLPMAIDLLVCEMKFSGQMHSAMLRLPHYFSTFQCFVIEMAESDKSRLDFNVALQILEREATYRSQGATPQGIFFYQFEVLSRNRLGFDQSLTAIAGDPIFDAGWRDWIAFVRRQIGILGLPDLVYSRSSHFRTILARDGREPENSDVAILFGEKEGQIALAHRDKDPLFFFAALERHLSYPSVPRPKPIESDTTSVPQLVRKIQQLESRVRLLEEEARGGIDLQKLYTAPSEPPVAGDDPSIPPPRGETWE